MYENYDFNELIETIGFKNAVELMKKGEVEDERITVADNGNMADRVHAEDPKK